MSWITQTLHLSAPFCVVVSPIVTQASKRLPILVITLVGTHNMKDLCNIVYLSVIGHVTINFNYSLMVLQN